MSPCTDLHTRLKKLALKYPGATEHHPWGETAIKVRDKVFLFLYIAEDERAVGFTVKLPESRELALSFPFVEPSGYGLGKSGWVTARLEIDDNMPIDHIEAWVDESYRTIAPKKLVKELDNRG